jgi:hypothetical protein
MGEGDSDLASVVSRPLDPRRILYVGLTETTPFETASIAKHGLAHLDPEELAASPEPVLVWLRGTGAKRVAVHFDVDVLEPGHYDFNEHVFVIIVNVFQGRRILTASPECRLAPVYSSPYRSKTRSCAALCRQGPKQKC